MYYFIYNPSSKSKKGRTLWNDIETELKHRKVIYEKYETTHQGHARELAHEITANDCNATVIVVGGDGTIHEAINGLTHLDTVTFACIPTGSGNDFIRGIDAPSDMAQVLHAILHPRRKISMDLGIVIRDNTVTRFAVSSGIGFDAGVCHEALSSRTKNTLNKLHLGNLTYAILAAKQLLHFKPTPFTIILDGKQRLTYKTGFFAAVMNQPYEGGGLKLCPHGSSIDGHLDLFVAANLSKLTILLMLPAAFFGKHTHIKGVHIYSCHSAQIITDRSCPIHLDGESGGIHQSLNVSISKEKLSVIVG